MKGTIQKAAIRRLAKDGYGGTSMRAIAQEAQVAVGSLYVHFKNKKDLLDQLFQAAFDRRMACLESLKATEKDALSMLMAFIDAHFEELESDENLATLLIRESQNPLLADLRGVRAFKERLPKAIEDLLAMGVATGELRPLDAKLVSHLVFHMIRSAVYERQLVGVHDPSRLQEELKVFVQQAIVK